METPSTKTDTPRKQGGEHVNEIALTCPTYSILPLQDLQNTGENLF